MLVTLLADQGEDLSKLIVTVGIEGEVSWVPGLGLRTTRFRTTRLDWEIISLLLRDAERKLDEVAKQLQVSTRTVKRRLNLMMQQTAILVMPIVDLRMTEGISYQLRVQSKQGKKSKVEKSVAAKIGNLVFRASDSQNGSVFGFTGANVAEGNEILEWMRNQPGVKSADIIITEKVVQVFDWLESFVQRQLATGQAVSQSKAGRVEAIAVT